MSTFLITGVAGFIAAKVAEMLLEQGHSVVGVDNLNDYYDVRLKDWRLSRLLGEEGRARGSDPKNSVYSGQSPVVRGRFAFHFLDIENQAALEEVFRAHKFDAVFNLAARAGVRASIEHPHVYVATNVVGELNLLECMRKHGVKKQVLASSSSLYAGCPMPFSEEQSVNTPLSPYAATKKAAEMLAHSYYQLHGIETTALRYFTVYGPAGRPDMSVFRFIKWIDEGKPIELFGDGTQSRDFTYVDDIARGTILAAQARSGQSIVDAVRKAVRGGQGADDRSSLAGFDIINLGGGNNPVSMQAVIGLIEKAVGKKAKIAGRPFHAADVKETWADITKAERLLGWSPQISLEEGLRRSVEWHLTNRKLAEQLAA